MLQKTDFMTPDHFQGVLKLIRSDVRQMSAPLLRFEGRKNKILSCEPESPTQTKQF